MAKEGQEMPDMPADDEFFIPKDVLGGKSCKEGDKITFRVTRIDEDGDVGVKMESYGKTDKGSMGDDDAELRAAFDGSAAANEG